MTTRPIPVEDALKVIDALGAELATGRGAALRAHAGVINEEIYAQRNLPPFDNSQMDGYALCGLPPDRASWTVIGEVAAGYPATTPLAPGQAMRVFTGSVLPPGTEAVVMQEQVTVAEQITVAGDITPGQFMRLTGSDVAVGDLVVRKGHRLTPALVGLLTSLGVAPIPVGRMPRVGLFTSGDELVLPGTAPLPHQIIEGNMAMLTAAIGQLGIVAEPPRMTRDDPEAMREALEGLLATCDVVITTGGVSVGDHDHLKDVLTLLGVDPLFWRIRQRPGKPIFCGKHGTTVVLGLPGNPVSTLVCFYIYAWPLLCAMLDQPDLLLPREHHPLLKPVTGFADLTQFLRAKIIAEGVMPLEGQRSDQLRAFVEANCLIRLPEGAATYEAGIPVECILLPGTQEVDSKP